MERKITLSTVALMALALAPAALAQNAGSQAEQKKGTEMVARTQDQKPDPAPATQATPPDQKPQTETPSTAVGQSQDRAQADAATVKTFAGTILKADDVFVLKTDDNMTYQLDDQARAKEFEGKQVQVTGSLDAGNNTIRVHDIKQAA